MLTCLTWEVSCPWCSRFVWGVCTSPAPPHRPPAAGGYPPSSRWGSCSLAPAQALHFTLLHYIESTYKKYNCAAIIEVGTTQQCPNLDPVFGKTRQKRSFSMTKKVAFSACFREYGAYKFGHGTLSPWLPYWKGSGGGKADERIRSHLLLSLSRLEKLCATALVGGEGLFDLSSPLKQP